MARKPRKAFVSIVQTGLEAHSLAVEHGLGSRLPERALEKLVEDVGALGELVPGTVEAHALSKAATHGQYKAIDTGRKLVSAVRAAVQRTGQTADLRRGYGVGARMSPRVVRDVVAAIKQVLRRATTRPEEAASIGIVERDLAALRDALAAITLADQHQEKKRAEAPGSTRERNLAARRVLAAIDRIAAAGIRAAFARALRRHAREKKEWEEAARAAREAGRRPPAKPTIELPAFLTFLRQPHCTSFEMPVGHPEPYAGWSSSRSCGGSSSARGPRRTGRTPT